jgi:hypothetical protein
MNWKSKKDKIYFEDGSLRDILILDFSIEDWKKWVDLVNSRYIVEFYNGQTQLTTNHIDFEVIKDFWTGNTDLVNSATIYLNNIIVKCYFFDDLEFENDIQPKEFKCEDDHLKLMKYLKDISQAVNKEVILTEENSKDSILIEIKKNEIKYCA